MTAPFLNVGKGYRDHPRRINAKKTGRSCPGRPYWYEVAATDGQLLAEFTRSRSEEAFSQLVRRYADLVYSCALRQVRDEHVAEDVAQAAFLVLSRRAKSVRPELLAGWLIKTARYCGNDALRSQRRRKAHEQAAAEWRSTMTQPTDATTGEIAVGLDEAIARLRDRESAAVALRFLQGKPMEEVAAALGTSADAARKVVSRSLVKLRRILKSRGIYLSTAAALAAELTRVPAHAAPAGFAVPLAGAPVRGLAIAKGAMHMILWSKAKFVGGVAAAMLLAGGAGITVLDHVLAAADQSAPAPAPAEVPSTADYAGSIESPYLQLTGCRINQTLNLKLASEPQPQTTVKWYAEEYPQVQWTIAPELADKVTGYTITVTPVDNPDAREILQGDKGTELQPLLDTCRQPGEYQVQLTANGPDSKPLAQAAAHVSVRDIPYAQIMISDFQPDGNIRFTFVKQYVNPENRDFRDENFGDSGDFRIEKMTDDLGRPIRFTSSRRGDGGVAYHYNVNDPVPPGQPVLWAASGRFSGMVQNLGNGLYRCAYSRWPGSSLPIRRVELMVLPAGATLVAVDPDLPHQEVNGRIQLFLDTTLPPDGGTYVSVRYRLKTGG
jgi:RNA polymerase sigma factor (sigma-70 family)